MAKVICGVRLANEIRDKIKHIAQILHSDYKVIPGLVIIVVGDCMESHLYIKNKLDAAKKVGVYAQKIHLPSTIAEEEILEVIKKLNIDTAVHGIIVQLPLPKGISKSKVSNAVDPSKDVDGLNLINIGRLASGDTDCMIPCTPLGCVKLIQSVFTNLSGLQVAIIGRSQIVGKPLSYLLTHHNATVTLCHSHTQNLSDITKKADVVVVATAQPQHYGTSYFNDNACVIDVGINYLDNKIVGDVNFEDVVNKVKYITPVPKGVGPMTVTYVLSNTIKSACNSLSLSLHSQLY